MPFERFLEEHKSLLDGANLSSITDSFVDNSSKNIVEAITNSPEIAVCGQEAFKAVFQI
jgi:hypothetical protein